MEHLTKAQKQERKAYRKNYRNAVKQMKSIIKDYGPWDYDFLMQLIGIQLKHMQQYYHQNYNVMAAEAENVPTRAEIADNACALWDKWNTYANKYYLLELRDSVQYNGEGQALIELFNYLGQYLMYMWD